MYTEERQTPQQAHPVERANGHLSGSRKIFRNKPSQGKTRGEPIDMNISLLTFTAALLALTLSCAVAEEKKAADNTDRNKQDQGAKTKTPMDQSNKPEDIKLAATIRKMVVADKSLSSTAKNCKIITSGGMVTLRGPVNTAEEKATIEAHAVMSSSKEKVLSQLEVKAPK